MPRIHPGLLALSITAFAIGMAEFIVVGILPEIAAALDIPLSRAGSLVGLYALALALGTPIVVLLLSSLPSRPVLIFLIVLFLAGSAITACSHGYATFLLGRMMTAVAHGSFFAIGATVAARIAPPGMAARAIAIMFAGLTLAMVIGVPAGSLLGQVMGWRVPLLMVSALAALALLAIFLWLPVVPGHRAGQIGEQLGVLRHPAILAMMAITVLGFGGSFAAFTFIIPLLTQISGFTPAAAGVLLIVFGAATLAGNLAGGHLSSTYGWHATLRVQCLLLAVTLAALAVALPWKGAVVVLLFIWGTLAFGISPAVQQGMLSTAERYAPGAVGFSSALNISAFNLGIFFGENVGSVLVRHQHLAWTPWMSMAICLSALVPLNILLRYGRRQAE